MNSFADTVAAKYPYYVVRALGGVFYLTGAIIMCVNLWKTVTSTPEKSRTAAPAAAVAAE